MQWIRLTAVVFTLCILPNSVGTTDEFLKTPPAEAFAAAVRAGDFRYLSTPQCVTMIPCVLVSAGERDHPWRNGVRPVVITCEELLGPQSSVRIKAANEYVQKHNTLMYVHNRSYRAKESHRDL